MEWDRKDRVERRMSGSKRIEWLDYMKGIAILIVVLGHMAQHIGDGYVFAEVTVVCEMPIFFMLSGILANKITNRTVLENYKKKISSLGIPLISIGGIFAICIGAIHEFIFDLYHLSYWFLLSLLTCWLIFIPLLKGIRHLFSRGGQNTIVAGLGDLLLFLPFVIHKMLINYIPIEVDEALSLNFTFTYYRFFVVGYFLGIYYHKLKSPYTLGLCVLLTIAMIWLILINSQVLIYIPMTIQQLILSVCLAGTIYVCYKYSCVFMRKVVARWGRGSLDIYVFHVIIMRYISLKFISGVSEFTAFVLTLGVSIIVCELILLFSYPIEHNKYLRKYILGKF